MSRVYIAGPMTGYPAFNFAAFDNKSAEVRAAGHIPVSPADLDRALGFDPYSESATKAVPIDRDFLRFAIQRDVDAILQCDAMLLLPGWEKSRGASAERSVATWAGIPVFTTVSELEALEIAA